MKSVALIVIYNHRYDQNIEIVERIYRDRFSNIFHLMPFYTGSKPNVIAVYENSYYFQGYIAQGFKSFFSERFTHYFFISDDLILNPSINELNFSNRMGLPDGYSFLPGIISYHHARHKIWSRIALAFEWKRQAPGIEAVHELPSVDEALRRFQGHQLEVKPLEFDQVWQVPQSPSEWMRAIWRRPRFCIDYMRAKFAGKRYHLDYPLVGGYSDIFLITSDSIREFCHYCGVFSGMKLFVEHAIPTAAILSTKSIILGKHMPLNGKALWTPQEMELELGRYQGSLKGLLSNFPQSYLFLHPIKFSRWKMDFDDPLFHKISTSSMLEHSGFKHQIENIRLEEDDFVFESIGNDPYLYLPIVPVHPDKTALIRIEITAPARTQAQLFYQTYDSPSFTESSSSFRWFPAGTSVQQFRLPRDLNGHFRLDPGSIPGTFRIHSIEFRQ
jgi:hypothetical protein